MGEKQYTIGEAFYREWNRIRNKIDNIRGDGVVNTPTAVTIGKAPARRMPATSAKNPIVCRVQQSGGVAGTNKTVSCTFTYDIYLLDNSTKVNTTGGVITPKGPPRLANLHYTAATYGEYVINDDGSYALFLWNEAPDGTVCP